jgi:2-phospho-L-lactate guanylyltransferase
MPSMTTAVLIGMKHLDEAKSRLAPQLDGDARRGLMRVMLSRVAAAAREAAIGPVTLVSSDPDAPALAAELGIGFQDDGGLPWNQGLVHALAAIDPAPPAVLYLAGDLPLVTADELRALRDAAPTRGVVAARAHDDGTNALWVAPADALEPNFGEPRSAQLHLRRAAAAGLDAVLVDLPGLALDVDTPADARRAGLLDEEVALGLSDQLAR